MKGESINEKENTSGIDRFHIDIWNSRLSQSAAKNFGGDYTLKLPKNEKLVMITWKDDSLWYLTKSMTEDDIAETYKFQESTDLGIMEGVVTVVEAKEEYENGENE